MEVVQSVLVATQKDAEDIMRQNLDPKSLCVMVGALKRELCSNEIRKQEIKKQLLLVQKECRQATEKKKLVIS